jgi:hypothetical protein
LPHKRWNLIPATCFAAIRKFAFATKARRIDFASPAIHQRTAQPSQPFASQGTEEASIAASVPFLFALTTAGRKGADVSKHNRVDRS